MELVLSSVCAGGGRVGGMRCGRGEGVMSSNSIIESSMWQRLTQILEVKLQPEKECHLPRLPSWHEVKWTFEHALHLTPRIL